MNGLLGFMIAFYLIWQWGKKTDERIRMRKKWKEAFKGERFFFILEE